MRRELLNPVFMTGTISNPFKSWVQNCVSLLNNNEGKTWFIIEESICIIFNFITQKLEIAYKHKFAFVKIHTYMYIFGRICGLWDLISPTRN